MVEASQASLKLGASWRRQNLADGGDQSSDEDRADEENGSRDLGFFFSRWGEGFGFYFFPIGLNLTG